MSVQEAASRYARALFTIANESNTADATLNEIREVNRAIEKDSELKWFFTGPVVKAENQENVLEGLFKQKKLSSEIKGLLTILVSKRRFKLLPYIVSAYQSIVDASKNIDRGVVRSATTLFPEDRKNLETIISRYTRKKAVLEYQEDKELLGGLVAQVGSFTFDDSLETQLRLMREELRKRRAN